MQIDGPKYPNPVVLSEPGSGGAYLSLLSTLPEFRFKNRIVGFTDRELYVCTGRRAKSGYYEMICDPVPWEDVTNVSYRAAFSPVSVVVGAGLIGLGVVLFFAGWVWQTHTGPAVFWMPFAAPIAGLAYIFGARRLRLQAHSGKKKLWWVAPPLFKHEAELLGALNQVPDLNVNEPDEQ